MSTVAVRDLRNNTASVIRSIEQGEPVTLTSRGRPIARIVPIGVERRRHLSRGEVLSLPQADPALRDDLAALGSDETDLTGPLP